MKRNILILLASMLVASTAFAQNDRPGLDQKWYVGPLLGVSISNGNSDVVFGADLGARLNQYWGAGVYATYLSNSATSGTVTTKNSTTVLAGEFSYFFDEALQGLRVGGKAGVALNNASTTNQPDNDTTDFLLGPQLAYDYALGGGLSVGAEANILFITKSGSNSLTNLLGTVKFWF